MRFQFSLAVLLTVLTLVLGYVFHVNHLIAVLICGLTTGACALYQWAVVIAKWTDL